ncbi:MAG TPA: Rieske 2Fe-2S domain-containing protein [Chloroflexota bacterium]|nr:Rieske 2Fe-2S domain-containing protein [Chloroflexota bacterium]
MFRGLDQLIARQRWLDTIGEPLQKTIVSLFARGGRTGKQTKNLLNGTWFGHPLHPALTDIPIGAWTTTLVLDAVAAARDDEALAKAADITLATGLVGAAGAALTGVTDWSDTYGKERSVGLLHGLLMVATVATYSAALGARLSGARSAGAALGGAGYALLLAGAYLGGEEVLGIGYGVNHTAFQSGPADYVAVLPASDLPDETLTRADARGLAVLLARVDGQIYALHDTCVHAGCSLAEGTLEGTSVICSCHGSQFDLHDGAVINGPATMPEPHLDVRIENGMIEVKQAV